MKYRNTVQWKKNQETRSGLKTAAFYLRETRFLCKDSKFKRYPCEKRLEGKPPYSACLQQPRSCKSLCNELVCWYIHDTLTSATLIHVPNCFLMFLRTELLYLFASHHPHHCSKKAWILQNLPYLAFASELFLLLTSAIEALKATEKIIPNLRGNEFATSQLLLQIPNSTKHMDESSWKQCGTGARHSHAKTHSYDSYTFTHPWWEGKLTGRMIDPHRSPPRFAKVVLYRWQLMTVMVFFFLCFLSHRLCLESCLIRSRSGSCQRNL